MKLFALQGMDTSLAVSLYDSDMIRFLLLGLLSFFFLSIFYAKKKCECMFKP